ncbi:hypothetical protein C0995_002588 [Termitomyces sp. Mi166|nr:hypothetical protein C0995_002588 [Termitomyces sp. Mi166\
MFFVKVSVVFAYVLALTSQMKVTAADAPVLTAERVFHTLVDQSPYIEDRTTTVVWT